MYLHDACYRVSLVIAPEDILKRPELCLACKQSIANLQEGPSSKSRLVDERTGLGREGEVGVCTGTTYHWPPS